MHSKSNKRVVKWRRLYKYTVHSQFDLLHWLLSQNAYKMYYGKKKRKSPRLLYCCSLHYLFHIQVSRENIKELTVPQHIQSNKDRWQYNIILKISTNDKTSTNDTIQLRKKTPFDKFTVLPTFSTVSAQQAQPGLITSQKTQHSSLEIPYTQLNLSD